MTPAIMDSLYDLYADHGVEALVMGTRGLARELIVTLTMTHPADPSPAHVTRFQAVSRWDDDDDWFDEWAKPARPLTPSEESHVGMSNKRLALCRPASVVAEEFLDFLDDAKVVEVNLQKLTDS